MRMKEFAQWCDEHLLQQMNDSELCACFEWYAEQADLELQAAPFQSEWREYETIRIHQGN